MLASKVVRVATASVVIVPAAFVALSACNPFPSYNGFMGAPSDAAVSDVVASEVGSSEVGAGDASDASLDSGVGDGGPGIVSCTASGVLLCDTFDKSLDPMVWTPVETPASTVGIDAVHTYNASSGALHASVINQGTGAPGAQIEAMMALPDTGVYVRFFAYFDQAVLSSNTDDFLAILVSTANGGTAELRLEPGDNGSPMFTVGAPAFPDPVGQAAQAGQWYCLEWYVGPAPQTVWVGGSDLDLATSGSGANPTSLDQEFFGLQYPRMSSIPQLDVWIDDLVVATTRVGCNPIAQ